MRARAVFNNKRRAAPRGIVKKRRRNSARPAPAKRVNRARSKHKAPLKSIAGHGHSLPRLKYLISIYYAP